MVISSNVIAPLKRESPCDSLMCSKYLIKKQLNTPSASGFTYIEGNSLIPPAFVLNDMIALTFTGV